MALTLDDSGSMRWAFAPDNVNGIHATRRAKSSDFNPLYFNPSISYDAPIVFDTNGTEQPLSTSYSAALLNGYKSTLGSIDLRSDYKFTWSYDLLSSQANTYGYSNTSNRLGENPAGDFSASVVRNTNGTSTVTNDAGIQFAINRTSSSACSATATISGVSVTANCSRTATNTYTATLAQRGVPAYYYTYDSSLANNCSKANDDCYTLNFVSSEQQQNFANWYSFYRNRALATISAAALAFYDLSPSVRLTWQGLGNCKSFTGTDTTNCYNNSLKDYSPTHKGQLYAWLQNINFNQTTYLPAAMKRAGEFYTTSTPWQKTPNGTGNTSLNTYACRASYHILMTDGQWNSTTTMPSNFRHDAATFNLPDGRAYSERKPYYDSTVKLWPTWPCTTGLPTLTQIWTMTCRRTPPSKAAIRQLTTGTPATTRRLGSI
jgi:type IV pilus assembly protein PilY1